MRSVTEIVYTKIGNEKLSLDIHMPEGGAFREDGTSILGELVEKFIRGITK